MIIAVSALPADAASSHGQPFASLFRSSRLSEQATGPMSGTDAHRKARVAAKLVCLGTHMYVHTHRQPSNGHWGPPWSHQQYAMTVSTMPCELNEASEMFLVRGFGKLTVLQFF